MRDNPLTAPAVRAVAAWEDLKRFKRSDDGPTARASRRRLAEALEDLGRCVDLEEGDFGSDPDAVGATVQAVLRTLKMQAKHT